MELKPTIHPINLDLMQVAVIAASCCVGHIWMVGGGGGCSCMLLHPVLTSADAGPNLCILYTSCPLDLVRVVFPFLPTSANIPFAQVVVVTSCNLLLFHSVTSAQIVHLHTRYGGISLCNLRWWCYFIQPLVKILHLHPGDLHCVVVIMLYYTFI